jgi:hypothetical protein
LRFGTAIGTVLDCLSGGGRGIPGGGSGRPRPIIRGGRGGPSSNFELPLFASLCRCIAFQPHFFAVAAAFVTAASDKRFVSTAEDFPLVEDEFSLLGSFATEVRVSAEGASGVNDMSPILVGICEEKFELGSFVGYNSPKGGCTVASFSKSFSKSFSECVESRDEIDDWLSSFSAFDVCGGSVERVSIGKLV